MEAVRLLVHRLRLLDRLLRLQYNVDYPLRFASQCSGEGPPATGAALVVLQQPPGTLSLDSVPHDNDVFVPVVHLGPATLAHHLYCDWATNASMRSQLKRVACHPRVSIDLDVER